MLRALFSLFHNNATSCEFLTEVKQNVLEKYTGTSQLPGNSLPFSAWPLPSNFLITALPHGKNEVRELAKGRALKQRVTMR